MVDLYDRLGVPSINLSDIQDKTSFFNAFGQIKFDVKDYLNFIGGLNLNSTSYNFYDFKRKSSEDRDFSIIASPSLSINLDLAKVNSWKNEVSLHLKISHGFSPPTLEETLRPDGTINPDLMPEQGWNFEFGSRGQILKNLSYHFSIYSMQIKDLLVAKQIDFDQYVGVNAGKTSHNGFEIELNQRVDLNSAVLNFLVSYTYADYTFKEFIDFDRDFSGNKLTGNPPHLLNIGIDAVVKSFYGNIQYNFVDKMPMRDDNSVFSDPYQLLNLKVGYLYKIGPKWQFDLFAGINNIWNEKYASMILINAFNPPGSSPRYYYPGLPRNLYTGIKIAVNLK